MGTRAFIAKKTPSGYKAIYSHSDGYPTYVGRILQQHYTSSSKVDKLIALGDISMLREDVGQKHDLEKAYRDIQYHETINKKGWTSAFHRDRGDPISEVGTKTYHTYDELRQSAKESDAIFLYVFEGGSWSIDDLRFDEPRWL